jgi:hypothetical protein
LSELAESTLPLLSTAHYPEGKQGWMEPGFPWKRLTKNHFESEAALGASPKNC